MPTYRLVPHKRRSERKSHGADRALETRTLADFSVLIRSKRSLCTARDVDRSNSHTSKWWIPSGHSGREPSFTNSKATKTRTKRAKINREEDSQLQSFISEAPT